MELFSQDTFSSAASPVPSEFRAAPRKAMKTNTVRVLSLSGGGLLGVISAAMLRRLEHLGRDAHGETYRLAHSFDLVGGTSTGAILATAVALGLSADEMVDFYLRDAPRGLVRRRFFVPGVTEMFDTERLRSFFAKATKNRQIQSDHLATDLAIVVKSMTDGAPYCVTSVPLDPGASASVLGANVATGAFELTDLLRASTAVPGLFAPQDLALGKDGTVHACVDGGLSPYHDPSELLFRYARHCQMITGPVDTTRPIAMTAIGTGCARKGYPARSVLGFKSATLSFAALRSMVTDGALHTQAVMRHLSDDPTQHLNYRRLDMEICEKTFELLGMSVDNVTLRQMRSFLSHRGKERLFEAAILAAEAQISEPLAIRTRIPAA